MEKAIKTVIQAREEGETVQNYIRDLNTWENEMKQKEAALKNEAEQVLPPVRSRLRREKYLKTKKKFKKRTTTAYAVAEPFDPNKPYETMEITEIAPLSLTLDHKQSEVIKEMKVKEEAHQLKERGNKFVKIERWDDAIACYNRAIQLVKDDAIYYANRGLCYLKKESLHQAEADCTEALRLDPTYVKALQRRATAREKLGSLRAASCDLNEVLKLEPHNTAARQQLESIKQRMGTKGRKAKSSPGTTPTQPANPVANVSNTPSTPQPVQKLGGQNAPLNAPNPTAVGQTIPPAQHQGMMFGVPQASKIKLDIHPTPITKVEVDKDTSLANWKDGIGENVLVIKPVKKPPHLRSKRALKPIPIEEIPLGMTESNIQNKAAAQTKIIEIVDDQAKGDSNNNKSNNNDKMDTNHVENVQNNDVPMKIVNNDIEAANKNLNKDNETQNKIGNKENDINRINDANKDVNIKNDALNKIFNKDNNVLNKNINKRSDSGEKIDMKKQNGNDNLKKGIHVVKRSEMVAPSNSVQFMTEWRNLKGDDNARCEYLNLLEPNRIPKVFANALESDVLSEIIQVLNNHEKLRSQVSAYLKGLARVKRLSALVMFLSAVDKQTLNNLLVHCKTVENCSDADIAELKKKFEL